MRRRVTGPATLIPIEPVIWSPVTVNSPSKMPLLSLMRTTSPATVPLIGPPLDPQFACGRSLRELQLPCDLCTLLLKNEDDLSTGTSTAPRKCPLPRAGHVDRHQRPVDPVLTLRTGSTHRQQRRQKQPRHGPHLITESANLAEWGTWCVAGRVRGVPLSSSIPVQSSRLH